MTLLSVPQFPENIQMTLISILKMEVSKLLSGFKLTNYLILGKKEGTLENDFCPKTFEILMLTLNLEKHIKKLTLMFLAMIFFVKRKFSCN